MREVKVELDFSLQAPPTPKFDPIAFEILEEKAAALLITGSAGSGKTFLLEQLALKAIQEEKIAPEKIIFIAFSRHQARSVRKHLTSYSDSPALMRITTFHSFAYGVVQQVVNQNPELEIFENLKLLSGPEQEVRVHELLINSIKDKSINWPEELKAAVGTYGLTQQVRNLFARIRSLGMDPADLTNLGILHENPFWVELGKFAEIYLDVLDAQNVIDYAEVQHRAGLYLAQEATRHLIEPKPNLILVDEYQDIDYSQVRILRALQHLGTRVIAAGDKNASIFQFRGTDSKAIDRFEKDFFNTKVKDLETNYRRNKLFSQQIKTFETAAHKNTHLISEIRSLRTENYQWSEIAIIGRNLTSLTGLHRDLIRAQIPAALDEIENPIYQDAAVKNIFELLELAIFASEKTFEIDEQILARVLHGPLIEYSKSELRKTIKQIRELTRVSGEEVPSSAQALKQAFLNPALLLELDSSAWGIRKLSALVANVHRLIASGAAIYQIIWEVFSEVVNDELTAEYQLEFGKTCWRDRLYQASLRGDSEAFVANRALDSILSLFDMASREDETKGNSRDLKSFLQEVKMQAFAQETIAQKAQRDQVQLLTAHSAKARQWRAVFVIDLQEGVWPSDRIRNNLLEVERITDEGYSRKFSRQDLLEEERKLFYVATSRAEEYLFISAINNEYEDRSIPSQFLYELSNSSEIPHVMTFPQMSSSLNDLIIKLRRVLISDSSSPNLKKAAALRINQLLSAKDGFANSIAPNLAPEKWWGLKKPAVSKIPIREVDKPVKLSASQIKSLEDCSLKWFFDNDAGAKLIKAHSMSVGSVVHALANAIVKNEVQPEFNSLVSYVEKIWPKIEFEADWIASKEKSNTENMLQALIRWHAADRDRQAIAVEQKIDYVHTFPELADSVAISGRIDRIEADRDDPNAVYLVDFKTSKKSPSQPEVAKDPQLGAYRLAVDSGALDEKLNGQIVSKGAELVELRDTKKGEARVLPTDPVEENGILDVLKRALVTIRDENISATKCSACRFCKYKNICPAQTEGSPVI